MLRVLLWLCLPSKRWPLISRIPNELRVTHKPELCVWRAARNRIRSKLGEGCKRTTLASSGFGEEVFSVENYPSIPSPASIFNLHCINLAGFYRAPIARWRSFKVNFLKLEGFEQIWDVPNTDDICITLVWLLKVGEGFQCPSSSSSRFIHFWIAMKLFWGYIHEDVTNLSFLLF